MGFFSRVANVWNGFLALFVSDLETNNAEAVYESAIEERIKRHRDLKKAVSGIVYLRNKLQGELEEKQKQLADITKQLPVAIEEGEDEAALVLIQKKDELAVQIVEIQTELEKVSTQAEEAKAGLVSFQGEIEKLKREKHEMLAKKANAEARIQIQETLDGLSTEADIRALDNVREGINKVQAEADVGAELAEGDLSAKLEEIKAKTATASAKNQLEEMKKQMAAQKAAQDGKVEKTI
ncbi:MAG: PspA/IM30 family protein [Myxococcota bacterium]|mgnify:FL=1|jgi:phage shock protein A|nr:PspA/IM30 family protein [Myxococcota bacterium]MEC9391696.1 PspA/IM30 family protein [Myxococcota bacterium]